LQEVARPPLEEVVKKLWAVAKEKHLSKYCREWTLYQQKSRKKAYSEAGIEAAFRSCPKTTKICDCTC
jgi:hypothetical protein